MPAETTTPQTPAEAVVKTAEEYRADVVNTIVPRVIYDRLVQKHGFVIKTEAEANQLVAAAVELFQMKQANLLGDFEETNEEDATPGIKAANEIMNLRQRILGQYNEQAVDEAIQSNQELVEAALGFLTAN